MTDDIVQRFADEVQAGDALAVRVKSMNSTNSRPDVIYSGRVGSCSDSVYPSDVSPMCGVRLRRRYTVADDGMNTEKMNRWTNIGERGGRLGFLDMSVTTPPPDYEPAVVLTSSTTIAEFIAGSIVRSDALLDDNDPVASAKFVDSVGRLQGGR